MIIKVDQYQSFKIEMIEDWLLNEENRQHSGTHFYYWIVRGVYVQNPFPSALHSRTNMHPHGEIPYFLSTKLLSSASLPHDITLTI